MGKHASHIIELARRGATLRLRELANEVVLLLSAFPDLGDAFDADELPVSFILTNARRGQATTVKRKKRMSAATKQAVSRRTTKNWAERRPGRKK
jgi:hypothetical protein